jgi:hypothetical protein
VIRTTGVSARTPRGLIRARRPARDAKPLDLSEDRAPYAASEQNGTLVHATVDRPRTRERRQLRSADDWRQQRRGSRHRLTGMGPPTCAMGAVGTQTIPTEPMRR